MLAKMNAGGMGGEDEDDEYGGDYEGEDHDAGGGEGEGEL